MYYRKWWKTFPHYVYTIEYVQRVERTSDINMKFTDDSILEIDDKNDDK